MTETNPLNATCPRCRGVVQDSTAGCMKCEIFQCVECNTWVAWSLGGEDALCDPCSEGEQDDETDSGHTYLLPMCEVDREGSRQSPPHAPKCPMTSELASEVFKAFVWVEWVSVQRAVDRFIVKVKHSYPVDVRPELRAWLEGHARKDGATVELQVKAIETP